jgi:hypothetical protein
LAALQTAFDQLALFFVDQGLTVAEIQSAIASAFIRAAMTRARMKNGRVNQSGVAIMTGLTRTALRKLLSRDRKKTTVQETYGARRVLEGWARDPEFCTKHGRPRNLVLSKGYGSFVRLAKRYSGDIPPKATLDELVRRKYVVLTRSHVALRDETKSESRRQDKTLMQAAVQLSTLFRLLGYPDALSPTVELYDGVVVDVSDNAALKIAKLRVQQNARAFLNGIENSTKDMSRTEKHSIKHPNRRVVVNVAISSFVPRE